MLLKNQNFWAILKSIVCSLNIYLKENSGDKVILQWKYCSFNLTRPISLHLSRPVCVYLYVNSFGKHTKLNVPYKIDINTDM